MDTDYAALFWFYVAKVGMPPAVVMQLIDAALLAGAPMRSLETYHGNKFR